MNFKSQKVLRFLCSYKLNSRYQKHIAAIRSKNSIVFFSYQNDELKTIDNECCFLLFCCFIRARKKTVQISEFKDLMIRHKNDYLFKSTFTWKCQAECVVRFCFTMLYTLNLQFSGINSFTSIKMKSKSKTKGCQNVKIKELHTHTQCKKVNRAFIPNWDE